MNKATNIVNISLIILQNPKKQCLLLQRPANVHCPSCWSFPGGKVKPQENTLHAAQRELHEETSIQASNWQSLGCLNYQYDKALFHFHLFHAHLLQAQQVQSTEKHAWAAMDRLHTYEMPEANQQFLPIIQQLG